MKTPPHEPILLQQEIRMPLEETIVDILRTRAQEMPEKQAFIFLEKDAQESFPINYGQLHEKAMSIAGLLMQMKAQGERVLLLYPPGLDYICGFMGCLYAGAIAVPATIPFSEKAAIHLAHVIKDSGAQIVLSSAKLIASMKKVRLVQILRDIPGFNKLATNTLARYGVSHLPNWGKISWVDTSKVKIDLADNWQDPGINANDLAFLQYTSGSTNDPKGVMVSHKNIVANSSLIERKTGKGLDIVGLNWLPPYHDMGMIGFILSPICIGATVYHYSPLEFLKRPHRWLELISEKGITHTGGPNFSYDLCVKKQDNILSNLDLSSLKVIFNGAEPVYAETLTRFYKTFAKYGLSKNAMCPCYGMAEATLMITGNSVDLEELAQKEHKGLVSSGDNQVDGEILCVNPESKEVCQEEEVGEIWISGSHVTQGYWNKPQLTEETFGAYTADQKGPYLRTGDLGYWKDGGLIVAGRKKDLIIIRGQNYYPQDIEVSVQEVSENLRKGCSAALGVKIDNEEKLVLIQEIKEDTGNYETLMNLMHDNIATNHGIPCFEIVLIPARTIPKTANGKIKRRECQTFYVEGKLKVIAQKKWAQGDFLVEKISDLSEEITLESLLDLKPEERKEKLQNYLLWSLAELLEVEQNQINPTLPLDELGLDSSGLAEFRLTLEDVLGQDIEEEYFMEKPSLEDIIAKTCLAMG